jgi:hypothetical protein
MKAIRINRLAKNWLLILKYVDAFVVCSGIGDVIRPSQSNPCANCGSLQKNHDYLAVPITCMKNLMWKNGKVLPAILTQNVVMEISNSQSWTISRRPFANCKHCCENAIKCCKSFTSTAIFQRITTTENALIFRRLERLRTLAEKESSFNVPWKRSSCLADRWNRCVAGGAYDDCTA